MAISPNTNGSTFDNTGLLAYYKLEDVNDSSGNGYTLVNNGTTPFVSGKYSNCASFSSASGQYLIKTSNIGLAGGNCTVSEWVYLTDAPATNTYRFITEQADGGTNVSYSLSYQDSGGTKYVNALRVKHGVAVQGAAIARTLPLTTWIHMCMTYDGTNVKYYENGQYVGSAAASGNGTTGATSAVNIGRALSYGTTTQYWNGRVDETIIESRAWTAEEVAAYYDSFRSYESHSNGSWFNESGLLAYYKCEDGTDSSGNGYNMTVVSGTSYVSGKYGNCLSLVRASSQYAYVNSNLGVSGTTITLSVWFQPTTSPATGTYQTIVNQGDVATDVEYKIYYLKSGAVNSLWYIRNRNGVATNGYDYIVTPATTSWHNSVLTYDGTNVKAYYNGQYVGSASASGNGAGLGSSVFAVGYNIAAATNYFDGKVDETAVFNRAWTAAEVAKYYENSKGQFLGQVAA
jgi:hypothetical protein